MGQSTSNHSKFGALLWSSAEPPRFFASYSNLSVRWSMLIKTANMLSAKVRERAVRLVHRIARQCTGRALIEVRSDAQPRQWLAPRLPQGRYLDLCWVFGPQGSLNNLVPKRSPKVGRNFLASVINAGAGEMLRHLQNHGAALRCSTERNLTLC